MENIYPMTLEKEVLREISAGIIGDLVRYFCNNNISTDDRNNPLVVLYWKVAKLGDNLLQNVYHSMEELKGVSAQLIFIREYVGDLCNA